MTKRPQTYTPFIILGTQRTGSNYLSSLLASHPSVVSMGEIFEESLIMAKSIGTYLGYYRWIKFFRNIAPRWFVRYVIFRKYPSRIKAVGFRFFYHHAEGRFHSVCTYLQHMPQLKIIHLKRRNMLNTFMSLQMARKSGLWTSYAPSHRPPMSLTVTPQECESFFTQLEQRMHQFDHLFSHHTTLALYYEDLINKSHIEEQKIQTFLGVHQTKLTSKTYKLALYPKRQTISNYDQLKAYFQHSRWDTYFDE